MLTPSPSSTPPYSPLTGQSLSSPSNQSLTSPLSPAGSDIQPDEGSTISPVERSQSSSSLITTSSVRSARPAQTYIVASHSVRITKHGYAIEPIEIQYPEVINNLSSESRRRSDISFDSTQVGHKILALIRGFWSQPAFPKGRQRRLSDEASVTTILGHYKQFPFYPHKSTLGGMSRNKTHKQRQRYGSVSPIFSTKSTSKSGIRTTNVDPSYFRRLSIASVKRIASPPPASTPSLSQSFKTDEVGVEAAASGKSATSNQTTTSTSSTSKKSPPANSYVSWIPKDKERLVELITILCHKLEDIFSAEPRVLQLESPCIVLGDIHGNLTDLRTYERSLWPKAPNCTTNSYLFLGDYVDRGDYSIECVLYLFSMKLISPNRFYLLRGNHEVAALQLQYTFCRECEVKFGTSLGRKLWRVFNKVFDLLPLAALIDNQIFCAHGGIPRSVTEVSLLSRIIPAPLENPEHQCAAAWEILWNDPITDSELVGMIEMDNVGVTQTNIAAPIQSTSPTSSGVVSHSSDPVELGTRNNRPTVTQQSTATAAAASSSTSTKKEVESIQTNPSDKNKVKGTATIVIAGPTATSTSKISSNETSSPSTTTTTTSMSRDVSNVAKSTSSSGAMNGASSQDYSNTSGQQQNSSSSDSDVTRNLNGSDSILAREAASPLSFYIRPDSQQPVESLAAGSMAKVVSHSAGMKKSGRSNSNTSDSSNHQAHNTTHNSVEQQQTLRSIPSDTSSIASTSPQQMINDGFVNNIKRGTAYLFSDQAINNFLRVNNLTHVIRAHEVIPTGFAFHGDGRVITIFSSSKYCGLNNQAACALVDNNCIRILRLDTGDAGE